ncbi:MAG: 50S ribosomal protein L1 [Phycisphaerales bacterium]|nr:50S ribosomal protein L1 [Phycisphaerales bacterium]
MARINKRRKHNLALCPQGPVEPASAVSLLKKFKAPKFDQTVEICVHLGVDTKQADQMLRGSVSLPKGIGKSKRVVAFCPSDVAKKAIENGAIKAGGEDLVAEIEAGWMDFDVAVASPDMMRVISKLGRVLGPKGLMPSPKNGTVTANVADAVSEFAAGKVEYRTDKGGNVQAVIGKMSFSESDLLENLMHFIHTIEKIRPSTVKGTYIKKITISGTMTPGLQLKYESAVAAS